MSFYSDVYIACEEEAYEKFKQVYTQHDFMPTSIRINQNTEYLLHWSWVKWYDDFPEVQAITKEMKNLNDNEEDGVAYKFIKLNEDNTIETEANEQGWNIFENTCGTVTIDLGTFEED